MKQIEEQKVLYEKREIKFEAEKNELKNEQKILHEKRETKFEAEKNELKDELMKWIKEWKSRCEEWKSRCESKEEQLK